MQAQSSVCVMLYYSARSTRFARNLMPSPQLYMSLCMYIAGKDFDLKVMPHVMFLCIA
jgi:hypothetical protein